MEAKTPTKPPTPLSALPPTRGYQQEMLDESLIKNLIIALDTGSGKTHIAILRMKIEAEREKKKVSWFFAPTVALCEQQSSVISQALPVSVGLVSGALEPNQWKDPALWRGVLEKHRIMVTTPQVLLDALRHGYVHLGQDVGLMIFDEAHHAADNHPYNSIMKEFYFKLPSRPSADGVSFRPMVLGLTASPIYGGHVQSAFKTIEANLDSVIRTPVVHLNELATFVHRPVFKHVQYTAPSYDYTISPSRNVAALDSVIAGMHIENDPYVQSLRSQLASLPPGPDRTRVDQKLSKAILKDNTYTHKGLKDFARAASEICTDVGSWAADWYVEKVLEQAKAAASPYQNIISVWQQREKTYLLNALARVRSFPPSYRPQDIVKGISDKTKVLIECLHTEKAHSERYEEDYSGIVFVTRRDTVLALAEVLSHHPQTSNVFHAGCLLGSSDSSYRRSFLDITRKLLTQTQTEVLLDFKVGEKNLIVSTAVAEEGIDIQACGSVIRWDIPPNMISWAQSRGRARRQRSTFVLMFNDFHVHDGLILKWERLEKEMRATYNDSRQRKQKLMDEESMSSQDDENLELYVESTSALLTLDSAVAHLNHFCSVLPNASHSTHVPIYDLDPPDLPEGWHSMEHRSVLPYQGPWGSTVTLPKLVPVGLRVFSTEREYPTKRSAHRHVAFKAYSALYEAGLLNDHLLPLTSVIEPDLEEEVKALLEDVGKRAGTASVTGQMDPWAPTNQADVWWCSEIAIDGLPPLHMITRNGLSELSDGECPTLYRARHCPLKVGIQAVATANLSSERIIKAREFTRRILWEMYGSRMRWDNLQFAYLFHPASDVDESVEWVKRRSWLGDLNAREGRSDSDAANAEVFGECFSFPNDLTIIRERGRGVRNFRFIRWRFEPISSEEEQVLRERYAFHIHDQIVPPFLVVQRMPRRINFLSVEEAAKSIEPEGKHSTETVLLLRPRFSTVSLMSAIDTDYALFIPSIVRYLSMAMTVSSLRTALLTPSLADIPMHLLQAAITAPVSQEPVNYQRLETLGDTVLKFIVGVQLLAEYPLWHEGYLTKKKDHSVSNYRLAKEAHSKGLYRWIIRNRFLAQKWKPEYFGTSADNTKPEQASNSSQDAEKVLDDNQQLSTKMLADVVEALIGAAYLHGGFDLGVECAQLFGLGLVWEKLALRIQRILSRVETTDDFPTQTTDVERMLGYTFNRKLLLVEALTHASYQFDDRTVSYERMEFLGDSVLDMVVTDYLYHAPGKNYSPGHMHLRKSAVVNTHFLAYICLRCSLTVYTSMPRPNGQGQIVVQPGTKQVYLWQCLLHSSPRILDDFTNIFPRYQKSRDEIESALMQEKIFPWAALTRLQAPKLYSDMIESLLGAIYLDSNGDLESVRKVLRTLGILQILERIVEDNVDILHPVSRLSVWASRKSTEIEYKFEKEKEKGTITCLILLDGKEEYRVTDAYRGHASQNDVKFAAAETAIKALHLREQDEDVQIPYEE